MAVCFTCGAGFIQRTCTCKERDMSMKQGFAYFTEQDGWRLGGADWNVGANVVSAQTIIELHPDGSTTVVKGRGDGAGTLDAQTAHRQQMTAISKLLQLLQRVNALDAEIAAMKEKLNG